MTRSEANQLLNRVRVGADVSEAWITRALQVTGDLPGLDLQPRELLPSPYAPLPSFLNRSGRVMRGAGEIVEVLP